MLTCRKTQVRESAFTGSMISATWEFPKERRSAALSSFRGIFGLTDGPS